MLISVSINLNAVCFPVKKITFIFYSILQKCNCYQTITLMEVFMKKRYSMISVMICGLIFPSFSTANTLYFKGIIVEQTCKVSHCESQPIITCLYGWHLIKRKLSSRGKHSFLQKNQYISDVKIYSVNK